MSIREQNQVSFSILFFLTFDCCYYLDDFLCFMFFLVNGFFCSKLRKPNASLHFYFSTLFLVVKFTNLAGGRYTASFDKQQMSKFYASSMSSGEVDLFMEPSCSIVLIDFLKMSKFEVPSKTRLCILNPPIIVEVDSYFLSNFCFINTFVMKLNILKA